MAYIGREPSYGALEKQSLTADGSTTTFSLTYTVGSAASVIVSVNSVILEPETGYSLSGGGTQIIFASAPTGGHVVWVTFLGLRRDIADFFSSAAITGQTELAESPASADLFLVYDTTAGALKKVQNTYIGDINSKAALTTGVQGADELLIYDNSATTIKKITLDNFLIGGTELATVAADDDVLLVYDTDATEFKKIQKSNLSPTLTYLNRTGTGDGSTTTFTVTNGAVVLDTLVTLNGIVQRPTTDYTISGTTLTFGTAPAASDKIDVRELP